MQSFKNSLNFFKEKESKSTSISLHKFVLQKMSSQMAAERRQAMANRGSSGLVRKPAAPVPCISRTLYETPVSSTTYNGDIVFKMFKLFTAAKQVLSTSAVLQLGAPHIHLSVKVRPRTVHYHNPRLLYGKA